MPDASARAPLLQELRREGRRQAEVGLEGLSTRHDRVRSRVRLHEQIVEGAVDRVRENVRAADHGDTEDDRKGREGGAELAPREALQRDANHLGASSFIAASTSEAVAFPMSLTISPSARKRMRSAIAEARASC